MLPLRLPSSSSSTSRWSRLLQVCCCLLLLPIQAAAEEQHTTNNSLRRRRGAAAAAAEPTQAGVPVSVAVSGILPSADAAMAPTTPSNTTTMGPTNINNSTGSITTNESGGFLDIGSLPQFMGNDYARPAQVIYPRKIHAGAKLPLVMVLHAWGSNATYHDSYLGVSARANKYGFITLLPDGMKNSKGYRFWSAPACCNRENIAVDDLGYLTDLLNETKDKLPVDAEKIYVVGHSNGGQMALYLACRSKDLVRGFVSVAGFGTPPGCRIPRPCSALLIHGTEDDVVPYDLSTEVFDEWLQGEECLPSACVTGKRDYDCDASIAVGKESRFSDVRDANCGLSGNETLITEYTSCVGGSKVGFWRMEGATHVPAFSPQASDDMLTFLLGPLPQKQEKEDPAPPAQASKKKKRKEKRRERV